GRSSAVNYPPHSDGEHDYFDASATLTSRAGQIVPVGGRDYPLKTPGGFGFLSLPVAGIEVGNAMYVMGKDTIDRDFFGFGQWAHGTQYKLSFGIGSPAQALPQEALSCAPTTVTACTSRASCPSGLPCDRNRCQPAPGHPAEA